VITHTAPRDARRHCFWRSELPAASLTADRRHFGDRIEARVPFIPSRLVLDLSAVQPRPCGVDVLVT
jgi:hypothetical protein